MLGEEPRVGGWRLAGTRAGGRALARSVGAGGQESGRDERREGQAKGVHVGLLHPHPRRSDACSSGGGDLPGLDVAVGIGSGLGLDMDSVRRLVTGALNSLGTVATDVVTEFRQLTRGSLADGEDDSRG